MLEQYNEVLRRIECKVLDPHAQIVHDEPPLDKAIARQPRGNEPSRRAKILESFGKHPADELVRVAVPGEGYGGTSDWALGSPGDASFE